MRSLRMHLSANPRHGDGDIALVQGRVLHLPSCGEAAYLHFSKWKASVAQTAASVIGRSGATAWLVGPSGVRLMDAAAHERAAHCLQQGKTGSRFAWEPAQRFGTLE